MKTAWIRTAAAMVLVVLSAAAAAGAQTRPSIREAAARATFAQPTPPAPRDSNANGAAIGALVGAAGMGTLFAILSGRCGAGCENDLEAWAPYAAAGIGAAGGAAVGYLIDRARGGSRQKVAVVPAIARRERGVRLAVRF
ncbi:MAG TPA: hypothetical protein VFK57_00500 [Vicinamibacterales bacterium]|nr:hypothetical protein [Vicinamibacterales bacterium]